MCGGGGGGRGECVGGSFKVYAEGMVSAKHINIYFVYQSFQGCFPRC